MNDEVNRLTINVLERDKIALQKLAALQGETLSVLIRSILREELRRRCSVIVDGNVNQPIDSHPIVPQKK